MLLHEAITCPALALWLLKYWAPGPDSRNYPLAIGSDTILWSWSSNRFLQTPITIGSSDREIRNQTLYCQLNHDIKHSLGNFKLKLRDDDWMKNVRLMISIRDVSMGGVAASFMSADTKASWPVQCTHTVLLTIQHGLDMPYLACMCMGLTSLFQ